MAAQPYNSISLEGTVKQEVRHVFCSRLCIKSLSQANENLGWQEHPQQYSSNNIWSHPNVLLEEVRADHMISVMSPVRFCTDRAFPIVIQAKCSAPRGALASTAVWRHSFILYSSITRTLGSREYRVRSWTIDQVTQPRSPRFVLTSVQPDSLLFSINCKKPASPMIHL